MTDNDRHDCFIGRWVYFHAGHEAIIRKVWEANHRPILVLIMDTEEATTALERAYVIGFRLRDLGIPHELRIIPPIASVNWGRKVGYERNYIDVDEEIQKISATQIAKEMAGKDMNHIIDDVIAAFFLVVLFVPLVLLFWIPSPDLCDKLAGMR